ncbi:hypothetical protein [Nakamurella endophytica]|uniref:Integral membrane protein n=1 Tax=Nakamurella endophytica TaxID=1748367 RepID=A0A917SM90_9ACTN|nr:hypothetical protein [Nakamurella endophytica]GGL85794.1 hypothetical protein GCM10011594_01860 [Nakamurella endophytica]
MTERPTGPVVIPPPRVVAVAGWLVVGQGAALAVFAVAMVVSGLGNGAAVGQLLAQGAYYLVLAAGAAVCGLALVGGRRWGRTPALVLQLLTLAVAYWMAVPSGRLLLGSTLAVVAAVTGGLVLTRPANEWVSRFPLPGR